MPMPMPRTAFCIVCAALAGLIALLMLSSPAAEAETVELSSVIRVGDGENVIGSVRVTAKRMEADVVMPGFKLLALGKHEDGRNLNATGVTDEQGRMLIQWTEPLRELRVYPYGNYVIPDGWANVPVALFDPAETKAWELRVRSMRDARVRGKVTAAGLDALPARTQIAFAALDVGQDGTTRLFDTPQGTLANADGEYSMELPTGYYQAWAYWTDRSGDGEWISYIRVLKEIAVFEDVTVDFELERSPRLRGRVIDARTGEGIAAQVDLYSNQYLRQIRNMAADGQIPDRYGPGGEEIFLPIGTFDFQVRLIDPDDFAMVIKPRGDNATIRVITGLSAADFADGETTWEIYTPDMRRIGFTMTTHEHDIPLNGLDVTLIPRVIDAPEHLQYIYEASTQADDRGRAKFQGLTSGRYEVFVMFREVSLGELEIRPDPEQSHGLKVPMPFLFGEVKLPDGTVCRNMIAFIRSVSPQGQRSREGHADAFRNSSVLREQGRVFVPLLRHGATFEVRFAAMEGGRAFEDDEWIGSASFPLITETVTIEVDGEKGWEVNLELKPNPDYRKED